MIDLVPKHISRTPYLIPYSMKVNIVRVGKPTHLAKLLRIGRKTFKESFSSSNSKKNINKYLDEAFAAEKNSF